jgi:anti-sigma28 factor (negative regulator of flagellin synthesis)
MAMLENQDLRGGAEIEILPNENHLEHAKVHLSALADLAEGVDAGEVPVEQVIDGLVSLFGHATQHVEQVSMDTTIPEEGAMLRQALQQFGEIVNNGVKQVQRLREQESASEAQAGTAPEQDDFADRLQQKLQEHQMKLQMMQEVHQTRLNLRVAEVRQKLALRDAEVASKISQPRA